MRTLGCTLWRALRQTCLQHVCVHAPRDTQLADVLLRAVLQARGHVVLRAQLLVALVVLRAQRVDRGDVVALEGGRVAARAPASGGCCVSMRRCSMPVRVGRLTVVAGVGVLWWHFAAVSVLRASCGLNARAATASAAGDCSSSESPLQAGGKHWRNEEVRRRQDAASPRRCCAQHCSPRAGNGACSHHGCASVQDADMAPVTASSCRLKLGGL